MWVLRLLAGAFHARRTYVTSSLDSPTDVKPSKAKSDQLRLRQCSGERPPGALVREFCKKQHICTHCFHRRALRGVTRCEHCRNRDKVAQRKRLRLKYQREKAEGVCVRCHKKRAQATNVRCVECQAYHSAHKKKKRANLKRMLDRASNGTVRITRSGYRAR